MTNAAIRAASGMWGWATLVRNRAKRRSLFACRSVHLHFPEGNLLLTVCARYACSLRHRLLRYAPPGVSNLRQFTPSLKRISRARSSISRIFSATGPGTSGTAIANSHESSMAVSDSHTSLRICCCTARLACVSSRVRRCKAERALRAAAAACRLRQSSGKPGKPCPGARKPDHSRWAHSLTEIDRAPQPSKTVPEAAPVRVTNSESTEFLPQ